jgi:hypothetical protein
MSHSWQEKRREPRQAASGPVEFTLPDSLPPLTVRGNLLDISPHGFRASHSFPGLTCGQVVTFHHERRHGRARVAWTRVTQDSVESGFFVIED